MCPVATVDDLQNRVADAIVSESPSLVQSLVLPIGWPPRAQGVQILTYRLEAMATGPVAYDIHSAHEITISPWIAEPHVERIFPVKLGREYEGAALPLEADARQAEQVLVDVIARCRPAEGARKALAPYLAWVDSHPVRGKNLVAHAPHCTADPGEEGAPCGTWTSHNAVKHVTFDCGPELVCNAAYDPAACTKIGQLRDPCAVDADCRAGLVCGEPLIPGPTSDAGLAPRHCRPPP